MPVCRPTPRCCGLGYTTPIPPESCRGCRCNVPHDRAAAYDWMDENPTWLWILLRDLWASFSYSQRADASCYIRHKFARAAQPTLAHVHIIPGRRLVMFYVRRTPLSGRSGSVLVLLRRQIADQRHQTLRAIGGTHVGDELTVDD